MLPWRCSDGGGGTSPLLAEVPTCVVGWWVGLGPLGVLAADGVSPGRGMGDAPGCCR